MLSKKDFPPKAKVQVLTGKVSKAVLDSLIIADKNDVVLTARQINFEYHYDFTGKMNPTKSMIQVVE